MLIQEKARRLRDRWIFWKHFQAWPSEDLAAMKDAIVHPKLLKLSAKYAAAQRGVHAWGGPTENDYQKQVDAQAKFRQTSEDLSNASAIAVRLGIITEEESKDYLSSRKPASQTV